MGSDRKKQLWNFGVVVLAAALLISLTGCGARPVRYPRPPSAPPKTTMPPLSGKSYTINGRQYHVLATSEGYMEDGIASWYGSDFHGKKTANGERYNMYEMTAAHKTLPLNTWVKVTNLTNGREATVRINDRGPFVQGRIIDLSYSGAKSLGLVGPGTAAVRVEALGTVEEQTIDGQLTAVLVQPRSYREGRFSVQVGSFQNPANAQTLAERLKSRFGPVNIQDFDRGDAVFYRVQVGEKPTLGEAMEMEALLVRQGFKDCFVVAR